MPLLYPDNLIASARVKHMSSSKWRKLIAAVEDSKLKILESHWLWVGREKFIVESGFPRLSDTNEWGFRDCFWGPVEFKYLYILRIPTKCPDPKSDCERELPYIEQPTESLFEAISKTGKFPISLSSESLDIKAYEFH